MQKHLNLTKFLRFYKDSLNLVTFGKCYRRKFKNTMSSLSFFLFLTIRNEEGGHTALVKKQFPPSRHKSASSSI